MISYRNPPVTLTFYIQNWSHTVSPVGPMGPCEPFIPGIPGNPIIPTSPYIKHYTTGACDMWYLL